MKNANVARTLVADYQKALGLERARVADNIANTIFEKYVEPVAKEGGWSTFVEIAATTEVARLVIEIVRKEGYKWKATPTSPRGYLSWTKD